MAEGVGSLRSIDATGMRSSTTPLPEPSLRALTIIGVTIAESVPSVVGTTDVKDGTRSKVSCVDQA